VKYNTNFFYFFFGSPTEESMDSGPEWLKRGVIVQGCARFGGLLECGAVNFTFWVFGTVFVHIQPPKDYMSCQNKIRIKAKAADNEQKLKW